MVMTLLGDPPFSMLYTGPEIPIYCTNGSNWLDWLQFSLMIPGPSLESSKLYRHGSFSLVLVRQSLIPVKLSSF